MVQAASHPHRSSPGFVLLALLTGSSCMGICDHDKGNSGKTEKDRTILPIEEQKPIPPVEVDEPRPRPTPPQVAAGKCVTEVDGLKHVARVNAEATVEGRHFTAENSVTTQPSTANQPVGLMTHDLRIQRDGQDVLVVRTTSRSEKEIEVQVRVVDEGAKFHELVLRSSDGGQGFEGTFDREVLVPLSRGAPPDSVRMASGAPLPAELQVPKDVRTAIEQLRGTIELKHRACAEVAAGMAPPSPTPAPTEDPPGHLSAPGMSAECSQCRLGAGMALATCTFVTLTSCSGSLIFYAVCAGIGEALCIGAYIGAMVVCGNTVCCPVECGDACCESGELCLNPGQTTCCHGGMQLCGGRNCCPPNDTCIHGSGECCPRGQEVCGQTCCAFGERCAAGRCCANPCGSSCCSTFERCLDPDHGTCCPQGQAVCGGTCCPAGHVCVGGACCPSNQACGSTCCQAGQFCGDASSSTCSGCPTGTSACSGYNASTCCPAGTCCGGICCGDGEHCCGPGDCRPLSSRCVR